MLEWRQKLDPSVNQFKPQIPFLVRIPKIQGIKENKQIVKSVINKPFSVFVGRLSWKCTDEILKEQFQQFEPVSAKIV